MSASRARAETETLRDRLAASEAELDRYRQVIREATRVCREAARGNLEPRILNIEVEGDLRDLLLSLNHLLDLTDAFVREAQVSLEFAGAGRFYRRFLRTGMQGCFRQGAETINNATAQLASKTQMLDQAQAGRLALADNFESAVRGVTENVAAAATELYSTAECLVATAQQTTDDSENVAQAAAAAAENMATVSAASEAVSKALVDIDRQAEQSHAIARDAQQKAERATTTMASLDQSSHQIGRVVKLITQIAGQTKLLALNAGIEAARAGQAGKGFTVVANAVKHLAAETAEATKQISAQVEAIGAVAKDAVQSIDSVTKTVHAMNEITAAIRNSIGQQRELTSNISCNLGKAAGNTHQVTTGVNGLSNATRETSGAADQVRFAAAELSNLAESLHAEVESFLRVVRTEENDEAGLPECQEQTRFATWIG